MKIKMIFERGGDSFMIPINPEEIEINTPGNNEKMNVVGLGEIVIPREPGLSTFSINSFIDNGDESEEFIEFVESWHVSKEAADFTVTGIEIDMLVIVEDFTYAWRAGEEERLYYTLSLSEYRPHSAKVVVQAQVATETSAEAITVTPSAEARVDNSPAVSSTYTVVSGDILWSIAQKLSGNGANWPALYDSNRSIIGSNPDVIRPGQVLAVPTEWHTKVPAGYRSSSTTSKSSSGTSSSIETRRQRQQQRLQQRQGGELI